VDDALPNMPAQPDRILTPAEAQAMQDRGEAAAWVVTGCDPRHPGKLVARPHTYAHDGGRYLACVLVSDSLANLRARMPAGVSRRVVGQFELIKLARQDSCPPCGPLPLVHASSGCA